MKNIIKKVFTCCIACVMMFVCGDTCQALILDSKATASKTLDIDTSELPNTWISGSSPHHLKIRGKLLKDNFFMLDLLVSECETIDMLDLDIDVIPHQSFLGNEKLKKVILPKKLKEVEPVCFTDCYSLETVVLPDSLKIIGYGSFQSCPNLNMQIYSKVKLGRNVFWDSPGVTIVEVEPEPLCGCFSWVWHWMCERKEKTV